MTGRLVQMSRRSQLIVIVVGTSLLILGVAVASLMSPSPVVPTPGIGPGDASVSRTLDFTKGWRFALVNAAGITDPGGRFERTPDPSYDDGTWRELDLPHDWSIELLPTAGPDSGTNGGTGFMQGGLGWYRKSFILPESIAGKRISVEFDGVYMDATVYLNGQIVGSHPYGYTGFAFDLTDLAHVDGTTPNVMAVKVQNEVPSSRWYSGSGIYRNVRLVVTDPIHVARWGTFVTTPDLETTIASGLANVRVQTDVINETAATAEVRIQSTILDAAGSPVGSGSSTAEIDPGEKYRETVDIQVNQPRLWSMVDPYRYELRTELLVNAVIVDTKATRFGIRYFAFDPGDGFSLNGTYTKIQGVDMHHDLGALGAAVNRDAILRQMTIMKRMGVNALRTSHNPPAPELMEVCEELGIVVMVEAFDTWSTEKVPFDYARFFDEWAESDIEEIASAHRNSPAVIMWSIGNEIRGQTVATAKGLVDTIKAIDPTRPIVWGSDSFRAPPSPTSTDGQIAQLLDGVGLNYTTAESVDALHDLYPDQFWFESESSSSTSTRGYYQDPELINTRENYTPGRRFASSYDNNMASWTMPGEYGLKKDRDRKFFAGQFLWSGFDYLGEPTPFDVFPVHASHFGAVDTAGFPKDLYFAFMSQWTSDPMVHLVPMNWTDHEPGVDVEVWAYSNVDQVELFLNGSSLGVRGYDHKSTLFGKPYLETTEPTNDDKTFPSGSYTSPNGSTGKLHLTWQVPFEAGELVAVASQDGGVVARDVVRTAGDPYAIRLTPDRHAVDADQASLAFITVEVVDANGITVPSADNLLTFSVNGGRLVGLDNGRQESAEGYRGPGRSAFMGRALAMIASSEVAGPITVTAEGSGLVPGHATVWAVDAEASQDPSGPPIGIDPVFIRAPVGTTPTLPDQVTVVAADRSTGRASVTWQSTAQAIEQPGTTTVNGTVAGGSEATAVVTAYEPATVETWSTRVPVGQQPTLPPDIRVTFSDGVDQTWPVTWLAQPVAAFATPGTVTIEGTIDGLGVSASGQVVVIDGAEYGVNVASNGGSASPTADASLSGGDDSRPDLMLDGHTGGEGWSNAFRKEATALLPEVNAAHARDWVSVRWPTQQTLGEVRPHFTIGSGRALPESVDLTYWDGDAWTPVLDVHITWATTSEAATAITFRSVSTMAIRLEMTSPSPGTSSGFLQINELEVIGHRLE